MMAGYVTCPACSGTGRMPAGDDTTVVVAAYMAEVDAWASFYALTDQHDGPDGGDCDGT